VIALHKILPEWEDRPYVKCLGFDRPGKYGEGWAIALCVGSVRAIAEASVVRTGAIA
jgi:hypothetical protein